MTKIMTEIRIIKTFNHGDGHGDGDIDTYIPWITDSPIVLLEQNDLIYQFGAEDRYFVSLFTHWDQYESSEHKFIYATELYNMAYK